jgi:hypothetical protein
VGLGDQPEAFELALELNLELAIGEAEGAQSLSRSSLWAGAAVTVRAGITTGRVASGVASGSAPTAASLSKCRETTGFSGQLRRCAGVLSSAPPVSMIVFICAALGVDRVRVWNCEPEAFLRVVVGRRFRAGQKEAGYRSIINRSAADSCGARPY